MTDSGSERGPGGTARCVSTRLDSTLGKEELAFSPVHWLNLAQRYNKAHVARLEIWLLKVPRLPLLLFDVTT